MSKSVIAACDGACKGNPGPAAWGWVIADADERVVRWEAGPLGQATNNIAELTALERLLIAVGPDDELEVRMDSKYAMDAVTKWLAGWKKNGWKTADKKPVKNKELIVSIDALLTERRVPVKFVHVAAHRVDGDRLNAIADRAASAAADSQVAAGGTDLDDLPEAPDQVPRTWSASKRAAGPVVIAARYAGTCSCGKAYKAGEKITKGSSGWGHQACASA